jgi:hypothetical protein
MALHHTNLGTQRVAEPRVRKYGVQEQSNDIIECLDTLSKHIRSDSNKHIV